MDELAFKTAIELGAMVRSGGVGCLELLRHFLRRVDAYNPAVNAIVVTDISNAERRASAADSALARGEVWGPLHGVPITVKEAFDVAGLPTTWGVPEFADNVATHDAVAVERLVKAGAVLFGKTNVPAWIADGQSFNPLYGTTNNPWDLDRTPGGSSGGSAAALAAGLTALELGSDIASSIRNPAHFCGVFGHKPTYGLCPQRGHSLRGRLAPDDLNVVGPLARSAGDLELAVRTIAGPDDVDADAYMFVLREPRHESLSGHRVGLVVDDAVAPVDTSVQRVLLEVADELRSAGVTVDAGARPDLDMAEVKRVYSLLLHSAIAHRQTDDELSENLTAIDRLAAGAMPVPELLRGRTILHRDWLELVEARERMRWKWHEYFERYDLLLAPVRPVAAHQHMIDVAPQDRSYLVNGIGRPHSEQIFWGGYSGVAYLPATVVPAGMTAEGLPVGLQIIGPFGGDLACLRFAQLLERQIGGFTAPPGFAAPAPGHQPSA